MSDYPTLMKTWKGFLSEVLTKGGSCVSHNLVLDYVGRRIVIIYGIRLADVLSSKEYYCARLSR